MSQPGADGPRPVNEREIAVAAIRQAMREVEVYAEEYATSAEQSGDRYIKGCADGFARAVELIEREAALIEKYGFHRA